MVIEEILKRRSVRLYKTDQVPDKFIDEIIKAAQFAPTAMNKRGIEFVVIKDQKTKDAIHGVVVQQYLKEAPVLIVPVADSKNCVLPIQDLSIASAHIFLQAAALGLGTVWKNISPEIAEKVKEILNIPADYQMINIIPLGYSLQDIPQHLDKEFSKEKIHQENW